MLVFIALVVLAVLAVGIWYHNLLRPIAHIQTGEQRRKLWPVDKPIGAGAVEALTAKEAKFTRAFHTLKSGEQIFYQLIEPVGRKATHIVSYYHGYTSNSDMYLDAMLEFVREGALVVIMDFPNHGRSDGLLLYIPDWWAWVDRIWEFHDAMVEPLRTQGGKRLKMFGMGMSLGGGLTACLAIQRPDFFDGIVLVCPMLCVADEIKPPMIVQQIFKKVLGPFKLTWPLTPSKNIDGFDFRIPEHGEAFTEISPFTMKGLKPRFATAKELGFTFPDWMEKNMSNLRTPFAVCHSRNDKVTEPEMSERLYKQASTKDKTLHLYDDAFHCELFCCTPGNAKLINMSFEADQIAHTERCFADIKKFFAARLT